MDVFLRKYGNSTGLALPPAVVRKLGLEPKRRHTLADLIAQCDLTALFEPLLA
jgi:antitoxin component of MazEF toxin-antitoxin module